MQEIKLKPSTISALVEELQADGPSGPEILSVCLELAAFLCKKNKKYGDSALNPTRIVSKADPLEQIRVRMDDKLSRMIRGDKLNEDEDVLGDFVGYWVLMRVCEKRMAKTDNLCVTCGKRQRVGRGITCGKPECVEEECGEK